MSLPGQGGLGSQRGPVSRVELRIECQRLSKKDEFSKSDPCAVILMQGRRDKTWREVGRTENIENCHDPKFAKSFTVDYYFEEVQKVKIEIYDIDNATPKLSDDDFLGMIECNLGEIVSRNPFNSQLKKKNGSNFATSAITIRSEEVKAGEIAYLYLNAKKLDNKDFMGKSDPVLEIHKQAEDGSWQVTHRTEDFFGKSDPYVEIQRHLPDGAWQVVHRTEVIKDTLNPTWRPFELSVHSMCSGDKDRDIKFVVYDWDSDGSHDFIGEFTTTITKLASGEKTSYPCINPKKVGKKKYENSGVVHVQDFRLFLKPSFLEFIYSGLQINFTVGIDFTASNGDPSSPNSLHYMNPYQPNQYQQAIRAVGNVCQDYDTDKLFPVLGFGARIPPENKVSFEFAVNFNPQNPYCAGIDGILQAYQNCIQQIRLYGPTNVAPIIYHVARFAAAAQQEEATKGPSAYFVLLLLTDGAITDMEETVKAIIYCSGLPMSLIIVGVGDADFDAMNFLDGDNGALKDNKGNPALRDIVQFVPFRDFLHAAPEELAASVLAEVPQQVIQYYAMRKLKPKPAT